MTTGLCALASFTPKANADVPTRYYCGGSVEWFAQRWWERTDPSADGPARRRLNEAPTRCPTFAARLAVPGGIGEAPLPPVGSTPGGGAIDARGSLVTSITPDSGYGQLGALGYMLGRMFAGPGYAPESEDMSRELSRLAGRANTVTRALQDDAAFVRSEFATDQARAREDLAALRRRSSDLADASRVAARDLQASLATRPSPAAPVPPTALGAALDLLETRRNVSEIAAAVPRSVLRTEGRSVFGSLDGARVTAFGPDAPLGGALARERAKVEAALAGANRERADTLRYSAHALGVAERFAASRSAAGERIAADLVRESQSIRLRAIGRSPQIEVPVLRDDGTIGVAVVSDVQSIPSNAVSVLAATFEAKRSAAIGAVESTRRRVTAGGDSAEAERSRLALETGSDVIQAASGVFYSGALAEGDGLLDMGTTLLDVALGLTPGVGWGKDLIEAISGRSVVTGQELSAVDRGFAVVGVLTLGFGSKISVGLKVLDEVTPILKAGQRAYFAESVVLAKSNIAFARTISAAGETGTLLRRGERIENVDRWVIPRRSDGTPVLGPDGWPVDAWTEHFNKHRNEFARPELGGRALSTREEYLERAVNFAKSGNVNTISITRQTGVTVKWNFRTNEFATFMPTGEIITYHWLDTSIVGDPMRAFLESAQRQ